MACLWEGRVALRRTRSSLSTTPQLLMQSKISITHGDRAGRSQQSDQESELDSEDDLFVMLYWELEKRAAWQLQRLPPGHHLQPAALVHEAYIKLRRANALRWKDRAHFFAIAVKAMREVLMDRVRSRLAGKRAGNMVRNLHRQALELIAPTQSGGQGIEVLLDLDNALAQLECQFPKMANVVMLRFYGGFTMDEIAAMSDASRRTIERRWHSAREWLEAQISTPQP